MREFKKRKKVCKLCTGKTLDYKDANSLKFYINDKGKILPRRVTGTCAKHQRVVAEAVKRARHMAIIPFVK